MLKATNKYTHAYATKSSNFKIAGTNVLKYQFATDTTTICSNSTSASLNTNAKFRLFLLLNFFLFRSLFFDYPFRWNMQTHLCIFTLFCLYFFVHKQMVVVVAVVERNKKLKPLKCLNAVDHKRQNEFV